MDVKQLHIQSKSGFYLPTDKIFCKADAYGQNIHIQNFLKFNARKAYYKF
jgi:hypothetical protein